MEQQDTDNSGKTSSTVQSSQEQVPHVTSSKRKRGFELNAKGLFLTYPQCSIQPQEALDLLREICQKKKRTVEEYLIATEKHQDGNDHLHCWIKMDKAIFVRDALLFDLKGHHGNYQGARNSTRIKTYCAKEGNYIADPPYSPTAKATTWTSALTLAKEGNLKEALSTLESGGERSCRDLILHRTSIMKSLQEFQPVSELTCARPVTSYGTIFVWDRALTLVLLGPTNTGKTTLACSLLPKALFTSHLDRLAELSPQHEGIILDDMSFKHLHDEAQIHLIDTAMTRDIHVRYRTATLPAGTPRILTSNRPVSDIFNTNNPAICRRLQVIIWYGYNKTPMWEQRAL
uniref:Replication-associated protein n=1 Tax=Grus japonensis CRESS-DNA-virus sp. TaxID=2815045 RepID=A0A8A4XC49_9VIRU|nr:MAG: replication-associated protein [Grus japonensis CRESS-DNA-virus sp.]